MTMGYVQTKQAEYEGAKISAWLQSAAYKYLTEYAELTIWTGDDGAEADHWEIEITDFEEIKSIAKHLHENPNALDEYLADDYTTKKLVGKGQGENLANLLDCGIETAEANGYWNILIDWL